MAIKWYIAPEKTDWDQYWAGQSVAEIVGETRDEKSVMEGVISTYAAPEKVFFDGGSGLGRWPAYFKQRGYRHVIGLDYIFEPLRKLKEYNPQIDAVTASVESIPFKPESIDFYLSGGVIEHFEQGPARCLVEAYRILKENGILLVSVPYQNLYRSTVRRFLVMPLLKLLIPRFRRKHRIFYQYYYSRRNLRRYLREAGFTILEWFYNDKFDTPGRRIGLSLEFPFLRKKGGAAGELNAGGVMLARLSELISRGIFAASVAFVVQKTSTDPAPKRGHAV